MNGPITQNYETGAEDSPSYPRYVQDNSTKGNDDSQRGIGNPRIHIDMGKSVNAIALCAALCGICTAVTIGTVWHSNAREVATESQMRKTQNHVDEMTNEVKRLKDRLEDRNHAVR
jgi:hypothetical protein